MFGTAWNFLKRHKKKFILGGAVVGGAVLLGKYAAKKLKEFQEQETAECLSHARRQHHFDSNQRTCNVTALSMVPTLRESLMQALNSEELTAQLKSKPANKLEIWEDLKIISFTRTMTAVYGVCLTIVLLRVQLNIVGGYMYLDSLLNRNGLSGEPAVATSDVQQRYLENMQYAIGPGLTQLTQDVRAAVQDVLARMTLKEELSLLDLQAIMHKIRHVVECRQDNQHLDAPNSHLCCYMIPEDVGATEAGHLSRTEVTLCKLMTETRDMLESSDFHSVLLACLDTAFVRLVDKVAEYYRAPPQHSGVIVSPNAVTIPLARVIPLMNGMIHTVCADAPNQFVQELLLKEQVKDFAANVYEAFSQPEQEMSAA